MVFPGYLHLASPLPGASDRAPPFHRVYILARYASTSCEYSAIKTGAGVVDSCLLEVLLNGPLASSRGKTKGGGQVVCLGVETSNQEYVVLYSDTALAVHGHRSGTNRAVGPFLCFYIKLFYGVNNSSSGVITSYNVEFEVVSISWF